MMHWTLLNNKNMKRSHFKTLKDIAKKSSIIGTRIYFLNDQCVLMDYGCKREKKLKTNTPKAKRVKYNFQKKIK
jgi:hypothetical protein